MSERRVPATAAGGHLLAPRRRAAEQLAQRHRPAQVEVGVVLPREADAAEHLDAVLGDVRERIGRDGAGRSRGERHLGGVAVGRPSSASAASHAAPRACSTATSMSAQRCFTPWNCPIGRPNCSRTVAYSAAVSTHHAAPPAASAATRVAVTTSTVA